MPANGTKRWRAGMRQRRPRAWSMQAARCRVQFCATVLAALLSLATATPTRGQADPSIEYQVKAAFVFNFAKFVEWPLDTFKSENAPIVFCVFRHDPFGSALDEIIRGKAINNRAVLARRITDLPDLKSCQLVFISSVEYEHLSEVLKSLKGTSALVVGESEGFAERGGGIQFFPEDKKLRFAVNVDAIQRARLTVSSKLLALARIVHD
jgi:YfiR/HmsC-like